METTTLYKIKPFSGKIFCEIGTLSQKFDPYLVIRYGSSTFYTSVSKNTGKFPYWNDSFTFRKSGDEKIWVECWDYNVDFVPDREAFLGKGLVDHSKCLAEKKSLLWISMERPKKGDKDEVEKTCELLLEIEVCHVKKTEEKENLEEKEVIILDEVNANEAVSKENEGNFQQPMEKKAVAQNYNGVVKVPAHQSLGSSHRNSFSQNVKVIPQKVIPAQNFPGVINFRQQGHNIPMIYHQPPMQYP